MCSNYANNETIKVTGRSEIYKTVYRNGCYLQLFR